MPVGRRWPKRASKGDYSAACDVCGVMWRRSQLTPKGDGTLVCQDDVKGRDIVTLNEGNARAAAALGPTQRIYAGGTFPVDDTSDVVDVATVIENVTFGNGDGH